MRKLFKTLLVCILAMAILCTMFGCSCVETPDDTGSSNPADSSPIESTDPGDSSIPGDGSTPDDPTNPGEDDEIHGWYNYSPDSATFEEVDGDTQIIPFGTAFGSQVILNYDLAKLIEGEYRMSFVLDATEYDTGSEIWISILGAWNEVQGNAFRTGMHFNGNQWMDIASYGFAQGNNHGFTGVVSYQQSDVSSPNGYTRSLFPALDEVVNVDWELRYDENENICGYLLLNDKLVQKVDYTALYGSAFTFTDVEAVGFDIYCPVKYDIIISQVTVENIAEGEAIPAPPADTYDGWRTNLNGASTLKREADGSITITPAGGLDLFGSNHLLNSELLVGIEGEYEVSFDLTLNMTTGTEMWISLVGAYINDNNLMRSGLHFFANTWNNVAFYGSVQYGDPDAARSETGFFKVVWPEGTPGAPESATYPSVSEVIHVRETYTYDADENIIVSLYVNEVLVGSYNLNTYYGAAYDINDCTAVGIDVAVSEAGCATIKNFKVTAIAPAA